MKMRDLLDRQASIHSELKTIVDNPQGEAGDLSEDQEKRASSLQEEMRKVKRMIDLQADLDATEKRMNGISLPDQKFERETRSFSIQRAIQSIVNPSSVDAGFEREISQEIARQEGRSTDGFFVPFSAFSKRTASTVTSPSAVIGTELLEAQYIDLLREADPLAGLGIRNLTGLSGNVDLPGTSTGTAVSWVGDNSALSQTDMTFRKVSLTPHHCGAWAEYSRNMILQSTPDIETLLRSDLAQTMAYEIARVVVNGSGTNNEPTGILATTGIHEETLPTSGTSPEMSYVPTLSNSLFVDNVSNVSVLASSSFKQTVDELLTTEGLPIGDKAFFRDLPHKYTSIVPQARKMIAGDFSQVVCGYWGGVELLINPYMESAYKKGNVAIRIVLTMDVGVRIPGAFATFSVA